MLVSSSRGRDPRPLLVLILLHTWQTSHHESPATYFRTPKPPRSKLIRISPYDRKQECRHVINTLVMTRSESRLAWRIWQPSHWCVECQRC
ncbi:hypothetical protein SLE2022_122330 [Rubroshorea leprosula]